MLDFGASERRISNFPRPSLPLSASSPSVSLSVGRSVMPSETSEAPHSHLPPPPCTIHDPSPVHTRRDQIKRCADRFSACWPFLGPLPPSLKARAQTPRSSSDNRQCCLYTEGVHYPSFLAFLAPLLSILLDPPSLPLPLLRAPLPLFSPEKLFCLIHLH